MSESAFPGFNINQTDYTNNVTSSGGLSKRELFAAMAMQAIVSSSGLESAVGESLNIAKSAVYIANDLLRVLKEGEEDADK